MTRRAIHRFVRAVVECSAGQPAVRRFWRLDSWLRDGAGNVVAERTAVESGDLAAGQRACGRRGKAAIAIEENLVRQRITGDLRLLDSSHLSLNKCGERALFGNSANLAAETFVL